MSFLMKNFVGCLLIVALSFTAHADVELPTTGADFKSVSEAASIITSGNTNLKTYILKTDNRWTKNKNVFSIKGDYTYGENEDVRSAERWSVGIRYDRVLNNRIDLFLGEIIESNRFAGFSRRFNTDLGARIKHLNTDKTQSFGEVGVRYTIEKIKNQDDFNDWKGRAYYEIKRKFNESISGRFWIEYLPNFSRSEDYLINFEPSISVVMNKTLSLKFAFLWNYDNLPAVGTGTQGNGKHDYSYTTGIIANF